MGTLLNKSKGYKTVTSCAIAAVVAVLQYLGLVDEETAQLLYKLAGTLGLYGIYDKVRSR